MRLAFMLPLLAASLFPTGTRAQANAPAAEQEVLAVVTRLFDGMRAADTAMVRSTFHPEARLMSAGVRNGTPTLGVDSISQFIGMLGKPHPEPYDERTSNERVHLDGDLAAVWTDYAFYVGDKFSHCGVDAFHLYRGPDGWKIIAIADTRRREGCAQAPAK